MQLKKLDPTFYVDNTHLVQALDCVGGRWEQGKVRGYGIVVITINNISFGIPMRSNIKHTSAYITEKGTKPGIKGKGLDFTKALLLTKPSYVSSALFKVSPAQHKQLNDKEFYITRKFEKYVEKYIRAVKNDDRNILSSTEYRFTTLQNYHQDLGL